MYIRTIDEVIKYFSECKGTKKPSIRKCTGCPMFTVRENEPICLYGNSDMEEQDVIYKVPFEFSEGNANEGTQGGKLVYKCNTLPEPAKRTIIQKIRMLFHRRQR